MTITISVMSIGDVCQIALVVIQLITLIRLIKHDRKKKR